MAIVQHGSIKIEIPDHLTPPEKAGKLSPDEVKRIPRARRGIGLICNQAADTIEKAGASFSPPPGVSPSSLREAGRKAEEIDQFILDLEIVGQILRQANLLFDADAWEQIRKMNDQVKAQAKHDPALSTLFKQLLDFFALGARPVDAPIPPVEG